MENKTLASVLNTSTSTQGGQSQEVTCATGLFPFLYSFNVQVGMRVQEIRDLNSIDYSLIHQIAEFSAATTNVALEVWESVNKPSTRGNIRPQRTAA